MKKVLSVFLAMMLAFSAFAVVACADSEYQTYHIAFNLSDEENIKIVPVKGYNEYVLAGGEFKFTIDVADDYSDTFLIVQVDGTNLDPDAHGVYTISDINADHTVKVFFSLEENQSNMFASLIVFVRGIMQMFIDLFTSLFAFAA